MQELFPAFAFIAAYYIASKSGHGIQAIYWATAAAMLGVVLQLAWMRLRRRKIGKKHWLTAAFILVFGTITLIAQNPMIIKWKPSIAYLAFAGSLLGAQWLGNINPIREMLGSAFTMPDKLWRGLNAAWALFFIIMAALNLFVAYRFPESFWVGFKLWGSLGGTFLFMIAQVFLLRRYLKQEEAPRE